MPSERIGIVESGGRRYRVRDDAATALKLIELAGDASVDGQTRGEISVRLLFCDPEAACAAAGDGMRQVLSDALWQVAGIDVDGTRRDETGGRRIIDWGRDRGAADATCRMAYGRGLDGLAAEVSYRELMGLLAFAPHETPMGQAFYYRTAEEPKRTKHNAEEVRRWRKLRDFWALDGDGPAQAAGNAAADVFSALKRRACDGCR